MGATRLVRRLTTRSSRSLAALAVGMLGLGMLTATGAAAASRISAPGVGSAGVGSAGVGSDTSATCTLGGNSGNSGSVKHVIYIQFDNTHYTRDNPNVPSRTC